MKPIACGWQYIVYDIGNGRIRKVKHQKWTQYFYIFTQLVFQKFWNPVTLLKYIKSEVRRVNNAEKYSNEYIKKLLHVIPNELLGNPIFINDSDYEQDKVIILEELLNSKSIKETLNKYINLIHILWGYGLSENVFRFSANNGMNKDGDVVQTDFGEITHDKNIVILDIKEKRWTRYAKYLNREIKEYYLKRMDEEITIEKLNKLWRLRLT